MPSVTYAYSYVPVCIINPYVIHFHFPGCLMLKPSFRKPFVSLPLPTLGSHIKWRRMYNSMASRSQRVPSSLPTYLLLITILQFGEIQPISDPNVSSQQMGKVLWSTMDWFHFLRESVSVWENRWPGTRSSYLSLPSFIRLTCEVRRGSLCHPWRSSTVSWL